MVILIKITKTTKVHPVLKCHEKKSKNGWVIAKDIHTQNINYDKKLKDQQYDVLK